MFKEIIISHFHWQLNIGMQDIRTAWLLTADPVKLTTTLHRGNLVFRMPGSGKRISYKSLKKGLVKKNIVIRLPVELLPF